MEFLLKKMIKHIWSVLCRESLIDQETNNISLHSVWERLAISFSAAKTEKLPISIPINYEIVSFWVRDNFVKEEKVVTRYTVTDPEGKVVFQESKNLVFPAKIKRMRSRIRFSQIVIGVPGNYMFEISFGVNVGRGTQIASKIPLEVVFEHKQRSGGDKRDE